MKVFIHAGHLSLDNGACGPLSFLFDLARLLRVPVLSGQHYGDDALAVPDADWPVVQELLVENRMLYKVDGVHTRWQNVQNAETRRRLDLLAA